MQSITEDQLINIGFISKPYGFNGALIFALEEGDADDFSATIFFFIELDGKPVPFLKENIKMNGQNLIVKLEDVNTEAEAKILTGKKIFVIKKEGAPAENEMSWNDLVGYTIVEKSFGKLGVIERIEEYPQQIIAQCTVNKKEVLFPLHDDFITAIDDEKKELYIQLPEGLLDVYLK